MPYFGSATRQMKKNCYQKRKTCYLLRAEMGNLAKNKTGFNCNGEGE